MILLNNIHILGDGLKHIQISGGKITAIAAEKFSPGDNDIHLTFDNVIAFPGLINSHDHLDFNLFPQLGNRFYNNYTEWGNDIHAQNKKEIEAVMQVPQGLRTKFGIYKNLLNGVTTVVNHGEYLKIDVPVINVFQDCYSLHSVQFEKGWKQKLNKPFTKDIPFVIHAGEGTDEVSQQEIAELIKWNFFKRKIIAVHGVAMNNEQAKHFDALVWCPVSNYFLLNKTADIKALKKHTKIIFGTDSTLTAGRNIWEQLRFARSLQLLSDEELYNSITAEPAAVWGLQGAGKIAEQYNADIVIVKRKNGINDFDSFFALNPEDVMLVIKGGEIRLFDESLYKQLAHYNPVFSSFSKACINEVCKYAEGDRSNLIKEIRRLYPVAGLSF